MQEAWLLAGTVAFVALVVSVWAVVLARRAVRGRRALLDGIRGLGEGDLSRRLGEQEAGPMAAGIFNQAARDLDERIERALASLSGLRSLAGSLSGMVMLDLNGEAEVREVLGDLEGLTGHRPAAVIGRHVAFFLASESDWSAALEQLRTEDGKEARLPAALRHQGGELQEGEIQVRRVEDGGYRVVLASVQGSAAAAERAATAEARLAAFTAALPDGVALLAGGRVASANPRLARLLGAPADDLAGRRFTALVHAADLVAALALLDGAAGPGAARLRLLGQGGEVVPAEVTAGRCTLEGIEVQILLVREAGPQPARERRLALSGAWLGAVLEARPEGLAVLARAGDGGGWTPALANAAFLRLLGLPAGRLPRRADLEAALPARFADPGMVGAFLQGFQREPGATGHGRFETRDEPPRLLELACRPVQAAGESVGILLQVRDATEEAREREGLESRAAEMQAAAEAARAAAAEAASQRAEAARRVQELERAHADLRERDEMKTNLLGNFSHELQTPLVSIRGYTEMMLRGDLGEITPDQKQGLEVSLRNIQRLTSLIEQLMAFARTEEELTELTLETFPVWPVLEETISLLGDRVKEKGLRVTTRYSTDRLAVLADRNLMAQVFSNILGNAVKYSRQGGEVAVTVRSGGPDELVVEVRDDGVGIPRDEQERIFERGYRASTAGGTRGSGIGLALVREILKRHGCQIRVDSHPGQGSTFSFTLPLAPLDDDAEAAGGAPPAAAGPA